jgi:hypothetical protein
VRDLHDAAAVLADQRLADLLARPLLRDREEVSALIVAADYLRRKADEYRALGQEHCTPGDPALVFYTTIEAVLRELAEAIEHEEREAA